MSSLLPPNASPQELALEQATSRIGAVPVPVGSLWSPQNCPATLLPWLAWALSVDDWNVDWPESIKRAVIAESLSVHARKGTPWALRRAIVLAGAPNARVEEWFDYPEVAGEPYHFRVVVDIEGAEIDAHTEGRILRTIDTVKNCRSQLDALEYNLSVSGAVPVFALSLQSSEIVTVYPK